MFKIRKAQSVYYSEFNDCNVITYKDDDGTVKCAACTEDLSAKYGDTVEIYQDRYIDYRGYNAMALKVIQ